MQAPIEYMDPALGGAIVGFCLGLLFWLLIWILSEHLREYEIKIYWKKKEGE